MKPKEIEKNVSFFQLFRFASPIDVMLIILGTIFSIADGASIQFTIIYFGDILGALVRYNGEPFGRDALDASVRDSVLKMVIIGAATFAAACIQTYCWTISGENQARKIREQYFNSLIRQDCAWFDKNSTGELTTRLTADLNLIQDGISVKTGMVLKSISAFIIGFVLAFTKGWQLSLVLTACFPALAIVVVVMGKLRSSGSEKIQKAYGSAGDIAQQAISSIKTVHAFSGQQKEILKYDQKLTEALKIGLRTQLINGVALGSIQTVIFSVYALAFWYGNKLVPEQLDAGDVLNVLFAILIGSFSMGTAGPQLASMATATGAAKNIFETIDLVSPIDPLSTKGEKPTNVKGDIEFKNIDFHYPSRNDVPILKNFNLSIQSGTTVALVGSSGSGKSTIVKLFERFYDPIHGDITLDGNQLNSLNVKWLRQHIGIVSQEPILFETTIRQNILYGLPEFNSISEAEQDKLIENACRQANCYEFIMKLPKQFLTNVGESGGMMSGGQKQRIAIARAIIKNPPILLLDEATSALDTESERIVQEALEIASKNRTTIVIAHRLSTIKSADKIIVMEHGQIKESGSHSELIALGQIYAGLVNIQELKGEVKGEVANKTESVGKKQEQQIETPKQKGTAEKEIQEKAAKIKLDSSRLWAWSKPEAGYYVLASLGALVTGAVQPCFSVLFAEILTALGKPEADVYALLLFLLGWAGFVSSFMQNLFTVSGERIIKRLRYLSFVSIMEKDMSFFDEEDNSTGALLSKLSEDASLVPGLTGQTFGATVQGLGGVAGGLVIAFISCWQLALLILGMLPVIMIAGYLQMRNMADLGTQTKKAYESVSQQAAEAISSIRTIMTISQEQYFVENFNRSIDIPYKNATTGAWITALSAGFANSVGLFAWALALFYGTQLLKWGLYLTGDVLRAMFCIIFTAQAVGQVANFMPDAAKGRVAAASIFELLDRKPKIDINLATGEKRDSVQGLVKLNDVKFSYPTRMQQTILNGLSLEAMPGTTVALVGKSGCGKSTVIGLLERYYDSHSGSLTFDDTPIPNWNLKNLRSFLSIVGQEPVLFNISIRENIAYGAIKEPDELEIINAGKLANIHDFVMSLPLKYDTLVGEKGGQMSGGQKQRIAIARALIRNPKLLLLDEATSALDSESEVVVQEALEAASKGRTTIVIAHRLSTIQNADKILVVDKGVVMEMGNHWELIEKNGMYADLVRQQQLHKSN